MLGQSGLLFFTLQKLLLLISYQVFCRIPFRKKDFTWVVGVDEICANISSISQVLAGSFSVSLSKNRYYELQYGFAGLNTSSMLLNYIYRVLVGPILLAYLTTCTEGFIYIWSTGFLLSDIDQRDFEFRFIKNHGKKIVCYFVGSDIRSPKLSKDFALRHNLEVIAHYYDLADRASESQTYETRKRMLAHTADQNADIIFNAPVDQMSYLTRKVSPFLYFYPDDRFLRNDKKFTAYERLKIVHAPSSPSIKGTPLVRSAIHRLRHERYVFDYVELIGVSNKAVLQELRDAHIVLNEFYSLLPGLFGVEAMASHCALITSADERLEPSLQSGSNQAWLVTRPFEIYDNLKSLLDHKDRIKPLADSGFAWAMENAAMTVTGKKLVGILNSISQRN